MTSQSTRTYQDESTTGHATIGQTVSWDRISDRSATGISTYDWTSRISLRSIIEADRTRLAKGTLGTVGFLTTWWLVAQLYPPYLLPSPVDVVVAFLELLVSGKMLVKVGQSIQHFVPGLLIGTTAGVSLGIALGWSSTIDAALTPVVRLLRPIPPLAWIAVAIVWLGIGHAGAAFIVSIGALWINFYNSHSGVSGVSNDLKEVASSLGVHDDWTMIRRVVLPSATPEILTGIRTGVGRCWMLVVAAELFGAPGIGFEIINASQNLRMDIALAYMLLISLIYLVMDSCIARIQERLLAWRS